MRVLRLDKTGKPQDWISREDAACLYAKDQVLWELGNTPSEMLGGTNRLGSQTRLEIAPIIAADCLDKKDYGVFALNNAELFRRDNHQCMYCGQFFSKSVLTRDHIVPKAQGGPDVWTNVITSCKSCNHSKGARTPEQAGMELLAIPFEPNLFEYFYLKNHKIIADQMDFLSTRFSGQREWKLQ